MTATKKQIEVAQQVTDHYEINSGNVFDIVFDEATALSVTIVMEDGRRVIANGLFASKIINA